VLPAPIKAIFDIIKTLLFELIDPKLHPQ